MRYLLHHLLEEAASETPDALAVRDSGVQISYGELERQSNQVAHLLAAIGVSRGDRVGVYLDKSAASVLALYGIMKAGAAYVPFDPDAPSSRLAYITNDCGVSVILTGIEKKDDWIGLQEAGANIECLVVLNADGEGAHNGVSILYSSALNAESETPPRVPMVDQDLSYILYTSGSTGDPKGVMLTHRNALAFVEWAAKEFSITHSDRLSSHAPLHFDLSIFDIFVAAWAGASVHLVPHHASLFPPQLAKFIDARGITVWYSVPSILTMLSLRGGLSIGDLPSLRTVLFAGEVFPTKYLAMLMELLGHARFANLYGPTETNVCTWYDVQEVPDPTEDIPIGKAISNDDVFVISADGSQASVGGRGELCVRGATVMRGYWGDPDRTARSLIPDPRASSLGDPVYRTGDVAEILPDGNFRYLGRRDSQVKTRGYRIELGEIEAALISHAAVTECAVVAVPDEVVTNRIVAYVSGRELSVSMLVAHCRDRLPRYMVPDSVEVLAALPKTSTGKLDRRSLARYARQVSK